MCIQQSIKPLRSTDSNTAVPSPSQDNKSKISMEDVATPRTETNSPSRELRSPVSSSLPELPFSVSPKRKSKKSVGKKLEEGQIKSVRFNQSVTARPSLHKNNYTSRETALSFYSREEYEMIRKDLMKSLVALKAGNLVEEESDSSTDFQTTSTKPIHKSNKNEDAKKHVSSFRGLENYNSNGGLKSSVRILRNNAIWAVLNEQDLQVEHAEALKLNYLVYDEDALRIVYRKYSRGAASSARQRGVDDVREVSGRKEGQKPSQGRRRSLRKMFLKKSNSEKNMLKSRFPEKEGHHKQQRRWSLLSSSPKILDPLDSPNNPTAMMA